MMGLKYRSLKIKYDEIVVKTMDGAEEREERMAEYVA